MICAAMASRKTSVYPTTFVRRRTGGGQMRPFVVPKVVWILRVSVAGFVLLLLAFGTVTAEPPAGSIVGWGGQVVGVDLTGQFTQVAAGGWHSLALKSDGSIVAWGSNDDGQTIVPAPNTGFVAVAAGYAHSLGVKADGSIVAWGWNYYGQTSVPAPNTGFVAVAGGYGHSLGLKSDGSILAWGRNDSGQTTVPAPNTGFVSVAAGKYHSLGIRGSKADYNDDGFIDANDYAELWNVLDSGDGAGPFVEPTVRFWFLFDMDNDRDVDLSDFALFANAFTGE